MKKKTLVYGQLQKPVVVNKSKIGAAKTLKISYEGVDDEDEYLVVNASKNAQSFRFNMERNQGPFCCGVNELGQFSTSGSTAFTKADKITVLKEFFKEIVKESIGANSGQMTYYLTTVNNAPCALIDEALKDGELFTLVKTFKNANSGTVNKMYISNY